MGSWAEEGVERPSGDASWELTGEAGVLASGRAMGCDRMGEHAAFSSAGASALGFSLGSRGSGKRYFSGDFTFVETEASGIWGPYKKRKTEAA
jgi:hypothetical protein